MRASTRFAWTLALAVLLLPGLAQAAADDVSQRVQGGDEYVFGGSVRIDQPVGADLLAAGGNVDVEAGVGGDVMLVGGHLRVAAPVGGSVLGGGGRIVVDAPVGRNVRVGGGQIELSPKSVVAGNVTVGGGQVSLRGEVKGSVTVGGGRVTLDGPVGGDVESAAGSLSLGPNARIAGKLRVRSGAEIQRDAAAQVGAIETISAVTHPRADATGGERHRAESSRRWSGPGWLWTLGMMLLAVGGVAAMPGTAQRIAVIWRERFGWSLLWGFVVIVCVPVGALIVAITIIGIPLALLGALLYGAALLVAYAVSGLAVGQWALRRWRAADAERRGWRLAAAALGVVAVALLGSVPVIGGLFALLAVCAGLGAIVQLVHETALPGQPA